VKKTANGVATLYIGKLFECVLPCAPNDTATQYIFAGGERIASRITGGAPPPPPSPPPPVLVLPAAAASTTLYYHGDHIGSSSVITDADGRPQQRLAYMPYGATQANSGTLDVRHKYTGQELDAEIGLYFYNARYYDPVLGRFTQADTIVPNPANPQTLNRYSYALNNPMRYTDPTGYEATLPGGLQFDPAYYTQTPDPSSSFLSTNFTSANPYGLDLSVPDLTIDTSFAPLPTASDITATSTGESNGVGGPPSSQRELINVDPNGEQFGNPTGGDIRGCDPQGCGYYGAGRGEDRLHLGIDIESTPGQNVSAPFGGMAFSSSSKKYPGVRIEGKNYRASLLYIKASDPIARAGDRGLTVNQGDVIGTAHDITTWPRYQGITNHVHFQLRRTGSESFINPTPFIYPNER